MVVLAVQDQSEVSRKSSLVCDPPFWEYKLQETRNM